MGGHVRLALVAASAAAVVGGIVLLGPSPALSRLFTDRPIEIEVKAAPVAEFEIGRPENRDFGRLHFLGGLDLSSGFRGFGGLSGIAMSADGSHLTAISDSGYWLTAHMRYDAGRPAGLEDAGMAPLLGADGEPLDRRGSGDAEALTRLGDGRYLVSVERRNHLYGFDLDAEGPTARARARRVPRALAALPFNEGVEALASCTAGPLAGMTLAIAEHVEDETAAGWLISPGNDYSRVAVVVPDRFKVTDAACLPDGDIVLMERRFTTFFDVGMRIRRIDADALVENATVDGEVLFQADLGFAIDNMEALAVHRGVNGNPVLTVLSDDNYSLLQRSLLLQFELRPE